jgi:hypothetical protein
LACEQQATKAEGLEETKPEEVNAKAQRQAEDAEEIQTLRLPVSLGGFALNSFPLPVFVAFCLIPLGVPCASV